MRLQNIASGVQLNQEIVVLTQKMGMDKHPVHRIVGLVVLLVLDNLESTNRIKNKASGV